MPQEGIKPLTTENAVIAGVGKKVLPKDDVIIIGVKGSILGDGVEHAVHSALAEKLVAKGQATLKKKKGDKE